MVIEFGIMSNKWSIEADEKLTAYAAIIIYLNRDIPLVVLYNDECKKDQWAFSDDVEKRIGEIFGGSVSDFYAYVNSHKKNIRDAVGTIKKLV